MGATPAEEKEMKYLPIFALALQVTLLILFLVNLIHHW